MFKSVIERQRAGRLGMGLWWSVAVHAGLFGAVLVISSRPAELTPEPEPDIVLTLRQGGQQVAKGYTAPAQPKQATPPKPRRPKRTTMPTQINPLPADPQPVEPEPVANPSDTDETVPPGDGIPGGDPRGDPNSTVIGVPYIPDLEPGSTGTGEEVLPFGQGMTQPVLLGGPPLEYTDRALMARVEGTVIAKCVVSREGDVRDCRILKGLAHMDEEVLDALHHRRYSPVTFQGRPQSVSYVFTLRFKLPR